MKVTMQEVKSAAVVVSKKANKLARKNNITADIRNETSKLERREISSDTGYQTIGEIIGRTMTYSDKRKPADSIKRVVESEYTQEGKLSQRILSHQYTNNVSSQRRKINVNYKADGTNIVTVRFQPTPSHDAERVIQKGKPTVTSYVENIGTPISPIIEKTEIINYAHLNKSKLKSINTITDEYTCTSLAHTDIIKQDIKFKDGSQIILLMDRHNPVITDIDKNGIRKVLIDPQEVEKFINTLDKEVQDILRAEKRPPN